MALKEELENLNPLEIAHSFVDLTQATQAMNPEEMDRILLEKHPRIHECVNVMILAAEEAGIDKMNAIVAGLGLHLLAEYADRID